MTDQLQLSPDGTLLKYKSNYTKDDVKSILKRYDLRGLSINTYLKENKLKDLSFLKGYDFLCELSVTSLDDHRFDFLNSLKNLRSLSIAGSGTQALDFGALEKLESLTLAWRKGLIRGWSLVKIY